MRKGFSDVTFHQAKRTAVNFISMYNYISLPALIGLIKIYFKIETDSIVTIDMNGSVECNIKPGIFPSMKPTRSKRLWEILGNDNKDTVMQWWSFFGYNFNPPVYCVEAPS